MTRSLSENKAPAVQLVREKPLAADVPVFVHPQWQQQFPWLFQGTTGRGALQLPTHADQHVSAQHVIDEPFDLAMFGSGIAAQVMRRWRAVRKVTGFDGVAHALQVHGTRVLRHDAAHDGILLRDDADGHITNRPNLLLAVSIADCVPVFVVDSTQRAVAALHAGWRGVAGGILEEGLAQLARAYGSSTRSLFVHFGPAICGNCYEVGPEVHEALGLEIPAHNAPVDLRVNLAQSAIDSGIPGANVTMSEYCTRCSDGVFFSHRRGDAERQMGIIGIRGE